LALNGRVNRSPLSPLSEVFLPRGSMVVEAVFDPGRHLAIANYRIAKGLLDHLIGAHQKRLWNRETERLRGLEIEH
jgi:hypothetical protein